MMTHSEALVPGNVLVAQLDTETPDVLFSTSALPDLNAIADRPLPDFGLRFAVLPDFLPAAAISAVRAEAEKLVRPERSYIPAHKKGGAVAYETIVARAPMLAALYQSREMREIVSRLVRVPVMPTPLNDQSSLSVLVYDRPGDHIGWHYDYNFYIGRHFTVLLPVVNHGSNPAGLSHARLTAKLAGGERDIATPANTLVVFEGARVLHKVTPIIENERRLVVSMTYCADPRQRRWRGIARRVKDTAFFGIRALWT
jgi:hypothetical protein